MTKNEIKNWKELQEVIKSSKLPEEAFIIYKVTGDKLPKGFETSSIFIKKIDVKDSMPIRQKLKGLADTEDLPICSILWKDAVSTHTGEREANRGLGLALVKVVGYLLEETDEYVKVINWLGHQEEVVDVIPKCQIIERNDYKE